MRGLVHMKCPTCGFEVQHATRLCDRCGSSMPDDDALSPPLPSVPVPASTVYSPDRTHWWNGSAWVPVPASAVYSPDRTHWWNGSAWVPVPASAVYSPTGLIG